MLISPLCIALGPEEAAMTCSSSSNMICSSSNNTSIIPMVAQLALCALWALVLILPCELHSSDNEKAIPRAS